MYSTPLFVLRILQNSLEHHRVTVIVSNKTQKSAVKRNTMKRRMREVLKKVLKGAGHHYDVVVVLRAGSLTANYAVLEKHIKRGLLFLRVI